MANTMKLKLKILTFIFATAGALTLISQSINTPLTVYGSGMTATNCYMVISNLTQTVGTNYMRFPAAVDWRIPTNIAIWCNQKPLVTSASNGWIITFTGQMNQP